MKDEIQLRNDSFLPLRDVVFQALREAILTGSFQPGERLPEIQLAQRLGVSRTPLREALRMLEQEGLVVMYPRRGACVANISPKMLRDVLEVRRVLEELSVELACRNITAERIEELRETNRKMESAVSEGDIRLIIQYDEAFHDTIYRIADNQKLTLMINNLREQMFRYRLEYIKDEQIRHTVVAEHWKIIEALAAGDAAAAKTTISAHIQRQEVTVIQNITPPEV